MPLFKFQDQQKARICVIGDMMLDHYINGSCERISPEAPVQIVDVAAEVYSLGGAGNVLKNLTAFGCQASIISLTGNDDASQIVFDEVAKIKPVFSHLIKDSTRRTTLKSRVIVNRHQLIRLDKEDKAYCSETIADQILEFLQDKIKDVDVLILSDYCKGVLSPWLIKNIIKLCAVNNVLSVVDSKAKDLSPYYGAGLIKPNKKEAELASGIRITNDESLENACKKIAEITGSPIIVVTLSEEGVAIYHQNKITKKPTKAIDVFDVTGAGDTVIAALAFALANKMSIDEACNFANNAAAVVVSKFGSAVATLDEINNIISK
jgi:rfaE bifunctional protein kinase chain/domain